MSRHSFSNLSLAMLALACLLISSAPGAWAQQTDVSRVDSVLDRLEKRLLDQEGDGVTYEEREKPRPLKKNDNPKTKYKYAPSSIEAATSERDSLKDIATTVADLEQQIDKLASAVQKTKQTVLDDAGVDNFVSLDAQLENADMGALKSLTVKLDGFALYEINDAAGLWLPAKSIPLYSGPLQPGSHRIDVEARLVMRHEKAMPLNGDVYRFLNKSFDLSIPGGTKNARYLLSIVPPADLNSGVGAVLKEAL